MWISSLDSTIRGPGGAAAAVLLLAMVGTAGCGPPAFRAAAGARTETPSTWKRDLGRSVEFPPRPFADGWIVAVTNNTVLFLDGSSGATRWRRKLPASPRGEPVIGVKTVAVASDSPSPAVLALDPTSGEVLWKRKSTTVRDLAGDEERLFSRGEDGTVRRLDPLSGEPLWERSLEGGVAPPALVVPAVSLLVVAAGADSLVALKITDGARRWAIRVGPWPRLLATGKQLIAATEDGVVHFLDGATGVESARVDLGGAPAGAPVAGGGVVYLARTDGTVLALEGPSIRWRTALDPPLVSSPALHGGLLALAAPGGTIMLLDAATGARRGRLFHPERLVVSPVPAEDGLLVAGSGGTVLFYPWSLP